VKSYVITSTKLILGYADDMYIIIMASNHSTCNSEIQHVEGWAGKHNLKLNYKKSCKMPFIRPRCNRHIDVPPPAVKGINRVQHTTALGVTLSHNMTKHIDTIMAGCAHTLDGLRMPRAHGMCQACLQLVFRSTALAKLLYASLLGGALLMLARRID